MSKYVEMEELLEKEYLDTFDSCQTIEEQLDWLFCDLFGVE